MSEIACGSGHGMRLEAKKLDHSLVSEDDRNICWICLDGDSPERKLTQPCKCPRFCHTRCLARWQLQSAGTRREFQCDFCNGKLPDWRPLLSDQTDGLDAPAIMNVNFEGITYSFDVKPGLSGYHQFTEAIRHAFQLPADSELNITFTCDEPYAETGNLLTLQGPGAYDAAVYCASISAARRQHGQRMRSHSVSGTNEIQAPDGSAALVDRSEAENYEEEDDDEDEGELESEEQLSDQRNQQQHRHQQQDRRLNRGHRRSRTTTGTSLWPVFRSEEFVVSPRPRHTRARSLLTMPNSGDTSTPTSTTIDTTAFNAQTNNEHEPSQRKKAWTTVAKKMKAIYQKIKNK